MGAHHRSREEVEALLARMDVVQPLVNAVCTVHPGALEQADHAAVDYHMASKKEFANSHDTSAFDLYRQRFAGGAGTYPLVGTPEKIVDEMIKIANEGYAGAALTFVNYSYELPFFCDRVLPLMKQAGLRVN